MQKECPPFVAAAILQECLTNFIQFCFSPSSSLTGTLPQSIGQWTNLEKFEVYNNMFTGNLPEGIDQWSQLEYFEIFGNDLSGPFPQTATEWTNLKTFYAGMFCLYSSHPLYQHKP